MRRVHVGEKVTLPVTRVGTRRHEKAREADGEREIASEHAPHCRHLCGYSHFYRVKNTKALKNKGSTTSRRSVYYVKFKFKCVTTIIFMKRTFLSFTTKVKVSFLKYQRPGADTGFQKGGRGSV